MSDNAGIATPTAPVDGDEIASLRRALLRDPRDLAALSALAAALFHAGRVREAVARMKQRLRLAPDVAGFHHDLGLALRQLGDRRAAIGAFERAVALAPHFAIGRVDLGNLQFAAGDPEAACTQFRAAIALDPLWSAPHTNLGAALLARGATDEAVVHEAIGHYRAALERDPHDVEAANGLGTALLALGHTVAAIDCLRAAVAGAPDHLATRVSLGQALRLAGSPDEAADVHRGVVTADPALAAGWDELAQDLAAADLPGALEAGRRAVALAPRRALLHAHLGNLLADAGDVHAAIACYRDALRLAPGLAIARWNLALAELTIGDFRKGWHDYEARWSCAEFPSPRRDFTVPRLASLDDATGRTVLVHAEQGLGDTIQFIRFVPSLVARGARVVVEAPAELVSLLREMDDIGVVVTSGEPLPPFDCHVPLMSLPLIDGHPRQSGKPVPYVRPDRVRSKGARPPRVGIAWAGGTGHSNDRRRSLTLGRIATWFDREDIAWVGLQKDVRVTDAALFEGLGRVHPELSCGTRLVDFADTADLIASLDLVICVDTAVAHLAGAMGCPTWVLLPFAPDFRWMLERSDSPWYPEARLFRCPAQGRWDAVVAEVAQALSSWLAPKAD